MTTLMNGPRESEDVLSQTDATDLHCQVFRTHYNLAGGGRFKWHFHAQIDCLHLARVNRVLLQIDYLGNCTCCL